MITEWVNHTWWTCSPYVLFPIFQCSLHVYADCIGMVCEDWVRISGCIWINYRVVNLPGNKSISQGSGKYRESPGNIGKYRETRGLRVCDSHLSVFADYLPRNSRAFVQWRMWCLLTTIDYRWKLHVGPDCVGPPPPPVYSFEVTRSFVVHPQAAYHVWRCTAPLSLSYV